MVPVAGSQAKSFLASDGHNLIIFDWDYENTTIQSTSAENAFTIATVETESSKTSNRWNDGKADAKGRLWGGRHLIRLIILFCLKNKFDNKLEL